MLQQAAEVISNLNSFDYLQQYTYKNLAVKELKKKGEGKRRGKLHLPVLSETKTLFWFFAATFGFGSKRRRVAQLFLQNTFCSDPLYLQFIVMLRVFSNRFTCVSFSSFWEEYQHLQQGLVQ